MESYQCKGLTFTYPNAKTPALYEVDFSVLQGEFVVLCGESGSGKSTLLRLLKPVVSPHGKLSGKLLFEGNLLANMTLREQSEQIGFVVQHPENQLVTDKVWHELAFGLESLGIEQSEIRIRVAEMAAFFGIEDWFHKSVHELSGGQKQLLNLAAIMVMQPSVLLLDEPTAQLDPIAAQEFINTLYRINRDFGTTVILSEHRLEEALPLADRVLVLDKGELIVNDTPVKAGEQLRNLNHMMCASLPTPMRIWVNVENQMDCPVTVREGRGWLEKFSQEHTLIHCAASEKRIVHKREPVASLEEIWHRYEKETPDVLRGLSVDIYGGELLCVMGGNGSGKSTMLNVLCGLSLPWRGKVRKNGRVSLLSQDPNALLVRKTVALDLYDVLSEEKIDEEEKQKRMFEIATLCELEHLLDRHPYDLSGGEQQRAALAKVLLTNPDILLLDEPTKGFDAGFKLQFAKILYQLKKQGIAIVMVSHDIEFCAAYADRCMLLFDGIAASEGTPREFFTGNHFYTTAANRMAHGILPQAVLAEDIIVACGGTLPRPQNASQKKEPTLPEEKESPPVFPKKKRRVGRVILGCIFAVLLLISQVIFEDRWQDWRNAAVQYLSLGLAAGVLACLFPKRRNKTISSHEPSLVQQNGNPARTWVIYGATLILMGLTLWIGMTFFRDAKYRFISIAIVIEALIPFFLSFEGRKPQARELVLIGVLCALAVAGRTAFYMLPQFKPLLALVIISAACLGAEIGFLIGAVSVFVSNFFASQGLWTPWQMFATGVVGLLAGFLFYRQYLPKRRIPLCVFGGIATVLIYGGIMNPASELMWQPNPTVGMLLFSYAKGFSFDMLHAAATVFFLWFTAEPIMEKLERAKNKYGLGR